MHLICGPPAAGKSTHVAAHAAPGDIVIDFDAIAAEWGFGRERPSDVIGMLLEERNARLAALAHEPSDRVAWVILTAPSRCLRAWWCERLGVRAADLVVLVPTPQELQRRIFADPERNELRQAQMTLVVKWFRQERDNDPGMLKPGHDAKGYPLDPLHPWNRGDSYGRDTIPSTRRYG